MFEDMDGDVDPRFRTECVVCLLGRVRLKAGRYALFVS